MGRSTLMYIMSVQLPAVERGPHVPVSPVDVDDSHITLRPFWRLTANEEEASMTNPVGTSAPTPFTAASADRPAMITEPPSRVTEVATSPKSIHVLREALDGGV